MKTHKKKRGKYMSSQDIKRRLIDSTKDLIQKNGTVTIKDIADASYVNIASVNYHFGSKEALLTIVIQEILADVKKHIQHVIMDQMTEGPIEKNLEELMTYIYTFSMDNIGVLNYLFLSKDVQGDSSNLIIDHFFSDNEFTRLVYESLNKRLDIKDHTESRAKYLILFSAFSIPLFIQIAQMKQSDSLQIDTFKDPIFRQHFIKNIMKMVQ